MSELTMPTLNGMSKKSASIYSILVLLAFIGSYVGGFLPSYASAVEFEAHVKDFDDYQVQRATDKKDEKREYYEDKISDIQNEAAILQAPDSITPAQRLRLRQLDNDKAKFLRRLNNL